MQGWGILKTQPRCENAVLSRIKPLGYETYLPDHKVLIRHARKVRLEFRPLFSTYMFVKIDPSVDQWQEIDRLPGSIGFVRFGLTPSLMAVGAVTAIREAQNDGVFDYVPERAFRPGETVRIKSGPFSEVIASIVAFKDNRRHLAILNLLVNGKPAQGVTFTSTIDNLAHLS